MDRRLFKVVVVSPTWLGDAAMSLPLVGFLAAAPRIRVTIVARGKVGRVYWGVEGASDLVVLRDEGRLRRIAQTRAILREIRPDAVLPLPPSFSSALGCFLAGVRTRVGVDSDARRLLLTASIDPRALREEHLSENYLRLGRLLLARLGVLDGHAYAVPKVRSLENERVRVRERLTRFEVSPGGYAVVVPGATYGNTKAWPASKYRAVVRRLSEETFVVLAGSRAERALCERVGEGTPGVANLAGETTLGELIALLEGARAVIANDSGAPHLAASLGVPVIVVFGSTSPRWTAPLGKEVHVIREPVHCSPCFLKRCPTKLECYEGITVERVSDAALSVFKKNVEDRESR
jgi:heptosyltransferase-2